MNNESLIGNAKSPIFAQDYVAMRQCRHGTFLYNVHDSFISRSLDRYGEWCEGELAVLGQILKPGDVVLDIGANIGTHTVFFAKKVTSQGFVFAFEPQRLVFQNLCANIALNALGNVAARQQGVSSRRETIRLPAFDPRREMNFGAVHLRGHDGGEPIEVIRIDDLRLKRCNLIKVDVEGMECDVLDGARETIAQCKPVLFVENNSVERSAAIFAAIDSLNYDSFWHFCGYYNPGNYFGNRENIFGPYQPEANLLCFPRHCQLNISGLPKVDGPQDNWRQAIQRAQHPGR